jgi:hypothetical protein
MADQNNLAKPDLTSRYDNEVLETLRAHILRLWKGDYTGMAGLVTGIRRWVRVGTTDVKLVERNASGTEDTLFDSSLRALKDGTNVAGTWGISISGNAATATSAASATTATTAAQLTTARTIGGVSFNGTANINLPGVNAAGNQNTTGNAATATALSTASGAAPSYAARAWVNFNGTGTVAIRASGNVSSITDNGAGDYTVNFATAMPDANFSTVVAGNGDFGIDRQSRPSIYTTISNALETTPTTTSAKIGFCNPAGSTGTDIKYVCVAFFR